METKCCPKCKETKPVTDFWKCKYHKDGYRSYCKVCSSVKWHKWKDENGIVYLQTMRATRLKTKIKVLTHYGGGKCVCLLCGESRPACLTIDHIKGGGTKHFKKLGLYGSGFYQWLINNNYPKGYQTLCANCQLVKRTLKNENAKDEWRILNERKQKS